LYDGGRDVFAAIPAAGERHTSVVAGGAVTVGWISCSETGTVSSTDTADRYLTDDPKGHLLHGAPHAQAPVRPEHQFRFLAYQPGTVILTGHGSEGSHGRLVVTIHPLVEPVGASSPSPFPYNPPVSGVVDVCDATDPGDAQGRLTESVSYADTNVVAPAGDVASKYTREQALARYAAAHTFATGGHPQAFFGLLSAPTPARINPDGSTTPFYTRKPVWLIAVCDLPHTAAEGHGGPGGAITTSPEPAPGTSPSPGPTGFGALFEPYDESGHPLDTTVTGRSTTEQRAERFIEVPFQRNQQDSADGRQIGISYPADEPCATFSHLDVIEQDDQVRVQVWLRLLTDNDTCTPEGAHDATIGLRTSLGYRELVRGGRPIS
jgi:hypothetical protein